MLMWFYSPEALNDKRETLVILRLWSSHDIYDGRLHLDTLFNYSIENISDIQDSAGG